MTALIETEPILQWKAAKELCRWNTHTLGAEPFKNTVMLCCLCEPSRYNQSSVIQETAENIAATALSVESWSESPQV